MATPDDNKLVEKFAFVMRVLKHSELPKPDWKAITTEEGYSRPDKPREKFRKIVKDLGFDYVNDQIVDPNSTEEDGGEELKEGTGNGTTAKKATASDTTETPNGKKRKSPTKKAAKGASAKKAKVSKAAEEGDDEGKKDEAEASDKEA